MFYSMSALPFKISQHKDGLFQLQAVQGKILWLACVLFMKSLGLILKLKLWLSFHVHARAAPYKHVSGSSKHATFECVWGRALPSLTYHSIL